MKILVTGGSGFIGTHLVRRLLAAGHKIVAAQGRKHAAPPPDGAIALQIPEQPQAAADYVRSQLLASQDVVSVGEIGLDLHASDVPLEHQQAVFGALLDVAAETGRPVTIHCREAFQYCYPMVKERLPEGHPVHVHSFSDTPREMEAWLALNTVFSYNGMVTFKKAENIRETLMMVPLERLLTETDAPYLTPVPFRGKPNASKYIPLIAAKIAELRGMTTEAFGELAAANARRFFGIAAR